MYKSVFNSTLAAILLCAAPAYAADESGPMEGHAGDMGHASHFYVVPKVVFGLGAEVTHDIHTYDGDSSTGFGVDLGYSLGGPWGVELTYSSTKGDVKDGHGADLGQATYTGTGVLAVYTHRMPSHFALVGKLGWMSESEEIHGSTTDDSGIAYVIGAEYGITEKVEAVAEFEGTNIESPKGNAVMVGAKFIF